MGFFINQNRKIFMELSNNVESEDWKLLTKKEKEEVTNYFLDNDLMRLLPEYKSMTHDEIVHRFINNKITIDKLKIKININDILIYLGGKNIHPSSFINFNLSQIDYFITLNKHNEVSISTKLFDFTIDNILLNVFNSYFGIFRQFLNRSTDKLNGDDLEKIYQDLIRYKEKEKVIVKTYLMTDASGFVKIGKAICVNKRLTSFKTGNPSISIIATLNDNIENKLHKIYSSKRIVGEWFDLSQNEIIDLITDHKFKVIK